MHQNKVGNSSIGLARVIAAAAGFFATIGAALPQSSTNPAAAEDRPGGGFQTGTVEVKGGVATIDLPADWRYLQQSEARRMIEEVWGNRANPATLGLVLPPAETPWGGILVRYAETGHVVDSVGNLDPTALLGRMRNAQFTQNVVSRRRGQPEVEVLGWADPPHYDRIRKKLRWGRLLRIGQTTVINYETRILGSDGALVMTAAARPRDLAAVSHGARLVLERTELAAAKRYGAHEPGTHTAARGDIADLICGSTVRRTGLTRVLLRPLIALFVFAAALLACAHLRRRCGSVPPPANGPC